MRVKIMTDRLQAGFDKLLKAFEDAGYQTGTTAPALMCCAFRPAIVNLDVQRSTHDLVGRHGRRPARSGGDEQALEARICLKRRALLGRAPGPSAHDWPATKRSVRSAQLTNMAGKPIRSPTAGPASAEAAGRARSELPPLIEANGQSGSPPALEPGRAALLKLGCGLAMQRKCRHARPTSRPAAHGAYEGSGR